jgi:hypothetical protein
MRANRTDRLVASSRRVSRLRALAIVVLCLTTHGCLDETLYPPLEPDAASDDAASSPSPEAGDDAVGEASSASDAAGAGD